MMASSPRARISMAAMVCWALGLTGAATHAAAAPADGKTLVVMGDSYAANPRLDSMGLPMGLPGSGPGSAPMKCDHGATSWPMQLTMRMHISPDDVANESCPGGNLVTGPGYTLAYEAQKIADRHAFGPRTRLVAIQFGLNDSWGGAQSWMQRMGCMATGCPNPDDSGLTGQAYTARIQQVVTYIKYYAPHARIVLVGYPQMAPPDSTTWCTPILGVTGVQTHADGLTDYLDKLDRAQREAAAATGIEYFDTRAVTMGHDTCSPQPWVNGIFDPREQVDGLPFHPTVQGDQALADGLARQEAQ